MAATKTLHTGLMLLMNVLFAVALLLTGRIVTEFFGVLATTDMGRWLVRLTDVFVLSLGVGPARTPYGGIFDVEAAVTVVVLLLIEWALSVAHARA